MASWPSKPDDGFELGGDLSLTDGLLKFGRRLAEERRLPSEVGPSYQERCPESLSTYSASQMGSDPES